jgi:hypothetical protein
VLGNSDDAAYLSLWQVDEANNWTTVVPGAEERPWRRRASRFPSVEVDEAQEAARRATLLQGREGTIISTREERARCMGLPETLANVHGAGDHVDTLLDLARAGRSRTSRTLRAPWAYQLTRSRSCGQTPSRGCGAPDEADASTTCGHCAIRRSASAIRCEAHNQKD